METSTKIACILAVTTTALYLENYGLVQRVRKLEKMRRSDRMIVQASIDHVFGDIIKKNYEK